VPESALRPDHARQHQGRVLDERRGGATPPGAQGAREDHQHLVEYRSSRVGEKIGYSASKFAVIGLTQSMAMELASHGITVNAVCPAGMDTARKEFAGHTPKGRRERWQHLRDLRLSVGWARRRTSHAPCCSLLSRRAATYRRIDPGERRQDVHLAGRCGTDLLAVAAGKVSPSAARSSTRCTSKTSVIARRAKAGQRGEES